MTFGLLFLSGYIVTKKVKIRFIYIITILFFGSFLINLLGSVRGIDKNLSFGEKVENALLFDHDKDKSLLPQTKELASSIQTIHASLSYVKNGGDYFYGRFQFQQFATHHVLDANSF